MLLEKPIADTVADARKITAVVDKTKQVLLVGHVQRFNTQYTLAKQTVDEGKIGAIQYIQTRKLNGRRRPGTTQGALVAPHVPGRARL